MIRIEMIQHLLILMEYKDGLQASSTKVKHLDCPLVAGCRIFEISSPLILVNGVLARQKILSTQIFPQIFFCHFEVTIVGLVMLMCSQVVKCSFF